MMQMNAKRAGAAACRASLSLALAVAFVPIAAGGASAAQAATAKSSKVSTKAYTLSKKAGTYTSATKVKLKAKKGYTVYYSTSGKIKKSKKVKSGKTKTIVIKKTTTLKVYWVKKGVKVTKKKLNKKTSSHYKTYKYTIKRAASSASGAASAGSTGADATSTDATSAETGATSADAGTTTIAGTTGEASDVENSASDATEAQPGTTGEGSATTETAIAIPAKAPGEKLEGAGYTISKKNKVTITEPGTYVLANEDPSTAASAQVVVDLDDDKVYTQGDVTLVLNGVNLTAGSSVSTKWEAGDENDDDGVLKVKKSSDSGQPDVTVTLADGSVNLIDTGSVESELYRDENGYYLDGNGNATSSLASNTSEYERVYPYAILCKKSDLTVNGDGALKIVSANGGGIKCTADLTLDGGEISVTAQGRNGISGKTNVTVNGGTYDITAANDGLKATLDLEDVSESSNVKEGSAYQDTEGDVTVNGGTFVINAPNGDGIEAYDTLDLNGGTIYVESSTEGLEGAIVRNDGATVDIVSTDDVINASGDVSIADRFAIIITAGVLKGQTTKGDGLDSNGSISLTGGETCIYVSAGSASNTALDSENGCTIDGGTLVASGPAGMMGGSSPTSESTQAWVSVNFSSVQAAGTQVALKNASGATVLAAQPEQTFTNIVLSSPDLVTGSTYAVYSGESSLGSFTASTQGAAVGSGASSGWTPGRPGGFGGPGGSRGGRH